MRNALLGFVAILCAMPILCHCQDQTGDASSSLDKIAGFPNKLFNKISSQSATLEHRLERQTERYLMRMARKEEKLRASLYKTDSAKAVALYPQDPRQQYAMMLQKFRQDSSRVFTSMGPEYLRYADSTQGVLGFLNKNPSMVAGSPAIQAKMQGALANFQQLQAKLQYADVIKQYIQSRKAQIQQALSTYTHLPPGVSNAFSGFKQKAYYYADQVRAYRAMVNDPGKMMQTALILLNKVPAFGSFMKQNGFLAGLFGVPAGYGTAQGMVGLQTRDQVMAMIQQKIGQGGPNGAASLQNSFNAAQQDIAKLQNKMSSLGGGSGGMDMPDFKVNDQHSKTLLGRLQYGFNIQTTRANYYFPTYTDIGLSLGYKLGHQNDIGIGASYKIGWGTDWQHIAFSSQGVGLRSFVDIHVKKSWSLSGGYELNYLQPFSTFKDIRNLSGWTQSGLIGVTKTISMKSTVLKRTQVQFFWDFLSYYQIPQQQPVIFRLGYGF
jgi:hypothetical protein